MQRTFTTFRSKAKFTHDMTRDDSSFSSSSSSSLSSSSEDNTFSSDDDTSSESESVPPRQWPPRHKSDSVRVLRCQLNGSRGRGFVRDTAHVDRIRDAVQRVHTASVLAHELLSLHLLRCLEAGDMRLLARIFDANWACQAWVAVSTSNGRVDASLLASRQAQVALHGDAALPPVNAAGILQLFKAEADKFVATATTNIKVHFRSRVKRMVRSAFHLEKDQFDALTKEERSERGKQLKKVAHDVCRVGGEECASDPTFHAWVDEKRRWFGLASIDWDGKPLEYHAAAQPLRFLLAGWRILRELEAAGRGGFALLPLRTSLVPRYVTVDTRALRDMLGIGQPESTKVRMAANRDRKRKLDDDDPAKHGRVRTDNDDLATEQWESWSSVFDFEAVLRGELCGMDPSNRRRMRFGFSLQTDGYGVSLKYVLPDGLEAAERKKEEAERKRKKKTPPPAPEPLRELPTRGLWTTDQLKHLFGKNKVPRIPGGASPQEIGRAHV